VWGNQATTVTTTTTTTTIPPTTTTTKFNVNAKTGYVAAAQSNELSFKRGELLTISLQYSNDWWYGQNANGDEGYIPVSHLNTSPTL